MQDTPAMDHTTYTATADIPIDQPLSIPIIDLEPVRTGSSEDVDRTAKEIYHAFKYVGFAYIKNHGVPQDLVDEAFEWVWKLF